MTKTSDMPKVSQGARELVGKLEECVHGYDYYFNCGEAAHLIDAELRELVEHLRHKLTCKYGRQDTCTCGLATLLDRWQVKV